MFRGLTYDVQLVEGGMSHEGSILCDQPEEAYDAPLTTLTVNFPGISSVDSAKLSVGGIFALEQKHKTDKAVFTVFRGPTYDILLVGGMSHEGSILCDQPRGELRRAADHIDRQLPRHRKP